ncbi:hypothetical protein ACJRO7_030600 [Eucalyptus globulus]|uniref:Patatin n=1 Tax=Eucalyptus globulus TaxID=34317 RepID=A0ABD3JFH0_EUCGL
MELSKVTLEIFTKLEQKWLSHCCEPPRRTRLLCIDGGGTSCAVAGAALVRLEDQIRLRTGDPAASLSDSFDLLAGTGLGGVLAAMLAAGDASGRPLYSAREAVEALTARAPEMFRPGGILCRRRRRFSGRSMDKVLEELFTREDGRCLTLKDARKPLLIPCFDLNSSAPFVFSRADATDSPSFDFELWKACRATLATPGHFKPFALASVDGKTCCAAVDGGLVMNNPTAAAVTHVLHNKGDFPSVNGVEDLLVLSLGNGSAAGKAPPRGGECSTSDVVSIALDGVSEAVDQMLGNAFCWNRADYVRIQASGVGRECRKGEEEEEVLAERGVESLPFGGKRLLTETNGQRLDGFVQRLVAAASGRSSLPPSPCKDSHPAVSPLVNGR